MKETVVADTMKVGNELVGICRTGRLGDAIDKLYSDEIVSIEAGENPAMPARVEGLSAVRGKNEWWDKNHEVHSANVEGPWPNGDRFIVRFSFDVTAKTGPMAGQRMVMDETALYTVADGKIVQEEFFYDMGGA
jgi:ketosteroid isomerase-like protein